MPDKEPAVTDKILDLLLDALLERQKARQQDESAPVTEVVELPPPAVEPAVQAESAEVPEPHVPLSQAAVEAIEVGAIPELGPVIELPEVDDDLALEDPPAAELLPSIDLDRMLGRLAVAMAVLIILINIPYNRYGTALARAMPDSAALIIRDGLLLKGSGDRIYVLQENQRRWITSLDAFSDRGYSWDQVQIVEDDFLNEFEEGPPIHMLLKCDGSPHIYALEDGVKRWIEDIPTFEVRGYVWSDVRFVSCSYLRSLPQGVPIPPDAGSPPQP